jgi:hydrogenase maturation protease
MTPVLIIGYGNPLRSDDAVGWRAAQALIGEWPAAKVRVETAHQLLPEMADWLADASHVLFIDACWDLVPGRIRSRAIHPEKSRAASMTHHFTPEGLLADAWQLFHHCPDAILVSVGGGSFEHGEGLSRQVEAVFPHLLAQIKKSAQKCLAQADCRKVETHA